MERNLAAQGNRLILDRMKRIAGLTEAQAAHMETHDGPDLQLKDSVKNCPHCVIIRAGPRWQNQLLMVQGQPSSGSWLAFECGKGGCVPCKRQGLSGPLPEFMFKPTACSLNDLRKHAKCKAHRRAVASFLGLPDVKPVLRAPTTQQFDEVRKHGASQAANKHGLEGVGKRKKIRRMRFCHAEARRILHRRFLRTASSCTLFSDERARRLLVRFRACNNKLVRRCGVIGQLKGRYDGHGLGIAKGIMRALERFCTVGRGAPEVKRKIVKCDVRLLKHMKRIVHTLTGDAAGNEQLAFVHLAGNSQKIHNEDEAESGQLSNVKIIGQDKAHAMGRVVTRPRVADAAANALWERTFEYIKLIDYSPVFSEWYEDAVKLQENRAGGDTTNLRSVKQRYASVQAPHGRACLNMDALIFIAPRIVRDRGPSSREGVIVIAWASSCTNCTALLLLAMQADAGDEAVILIRFSDRELMCNSLVKNEVSRYKFRVTFLFEHRGCLTTTSYTKHMFEFLSRARTVVLAGKTITIGNDNGCPGVAVEAALKHMRAWLRLSIATCDAEHPCFEILQAFHVFDLTADSEKCRRDFEERERARSTALKRLAQTYDRDETQLSAQYYDIYGLAETIYREGKIGCMFDAWKSALDRSQARKASRELHPVDQLLPVLVELGAAGGSSSGVEQTFTTVERNIDSRRRGRMAEEVEEDEVTLLKNDNASELGEELELAQQVWETFYGVPREPSKVTKLQPKRKRNDPEYQRDEGGGDSGFIKRRREAVDKATDADTKCDTPAAALEDIPMSDKQLNELKRQKEQRRLKLVDAHDRGLTIEEDGVEEALVERVHAAQAKQAKLRHAEWGRRQRAGVPGKAPSIDVLKVQRAKVFIEPGLPDIGIVRQAVRAHEVMIAQKRIDANVFVVADVATPSLATAWASRILGAGVVAPAFFTKPERHNVYLQYFRASKTRKRVFVTEGFKAEHPLLFNLLVAAENAPNSDWKVVVDSSSTKQ